MSVILETSVGDITIDLFLQECPKTCLNFLKLCKVKYYNNVIFHNIQKDYIIQSGDPGGDGKGGESVFGYGILVIRPFINFVAFWRRRSYFSVRSGVGGNAIFPISALASTFLGFTNITI